MSRVWPALLAVLSIACADAEAPTTPARRPNVIVILTDDQVSSSLRHLPLIDEHLVRQGVRFDSFLINDPLCCPSRVTILLGQYRHNHHFEGSNPGGCAFHFFDRGLHTRSLGRIVSDAGYRTGFVGKLLNRHETYLEQHDPAKGDLLDGWDEYSVLTGKHYYDFEVHHAGQVQRFEGRKVHQMDVVADRAVAFVEAAAKLEQPFLLYVAPTVPHSPFVPAPRHRQRFRRLDAPRIPSFDEADVSDKPSTVSREPLDRETISAIDGRYRRTLQMLLGVDEMVGRLVTALERAGALDRTYILYASDNGFHFGEHRIPRGKATPYEESIRTPLIVRGPGIARGETRGQLVANVDILPTVLDWIGVEVPAAEGATVDGRSLVPLLSSGADTVAWRHAFALEFVNPAHPEAIPQFAAVRTPRFKLVEYTNGERELYDLQADPFELDNRHGELDGEIEAELSRRIERLLRCSGAGCRAVEDEPFDYER